MALTTDILQSYRAPGTVIARLASQDRREARLLFYLVLACGLIFVAQWPRLAREAFLDASVPLEARLSGALFGWIFLAPLFFYAVAMLMGWVLRFARAGVGGFDVRLAVFWALLVSSPLTLLGGLTMGIVGPGASATLVGVVTLGVFLAVLIAGLRVASRQGG